MLPNSTEKICDSSNDGLDDAHFGKFVKTVVEWSKNFCTKGMFRRDKPLRISSTKIIRESLSFKVFDQQTLRIYFPRKGVRNELSKGRSCL